MSATAQGPANLLHSFQVSQIKYLELAHIFIYRIADDANEDDVKALVSEMETLAALGTHPNIVSLVRVCTVGSTY